jgi:hypothetical protein
MVSKWVTHVKKYAKDHKVSYSEAMKKAGDTYEKVGAKKGAKKGAKRVTKQKALKKNPTGVKAGMIKKKCRITKL